jgi:hypothetical protein
MHGRVDTSRLEKNRDSDQIERRQDMTTNRSDSDDSARKIIGNE